MYAYAHATLNDKTIKLTGFLAGEKLFGFIGGFYGLKSLPNTFHTTNVCRFEKCVPSKICTGLQWWYSTHVNFQTTYTDTYQTIPWDC